jgi:hypothetical protein
MARKTTVTTTRGAVAAEPVIEEVKTGGMGIDEAVILVTTLALLASVVLTYMAMARYPG